MTIDVDMMNYYSMTPLDEMSHAVDRLLEVMGEQSEVMATWFIRVDENMRDVYGSSTYVFDKYSDKISAMQEIGHEIGWHCHAYKNGKLELGPESDEAEFIRHIEKYGPVARSLGLSIVRMGWGQQTNASIALLEDLGFKVDSSAIPRPSYAWADVPLRDWAKSSNAIYFPDHLDYQVPNLVSQGILEVPISVAEVRGHKDQSGGILRYINPAYRPAVFQKAILDFSLDLLVTISHPYEFDPNSKDSSGEFLFQFDISALRDNIRELLDSKYAFTSLLNVRGQRGTLE